MEVAARILIIEDNATNMELMSYLLQAFGHTPLLAYDGETGVRMAREERPDLIVCDVHLPRLDGFGVAAAIRQDSATRAIPMLAVTALAMPGDRERLLAAGFSGYIGKPIEADSFVEQLERYLPPPGQVAADGQAGQASPEPRPDAATILIVDDHVLNREFLMTLLRFGGHRLVEASSGAEALEKVAAHQPELVISDILMPNMDGYEFVTRLRAQPETADLPVIFYTATYREREASRLAEACGVRWVLPKPSDPDLILRTVHEALGVHGPAAVPPLVPAEPSTGGAVEAIENKVNAIIGEAESSSSVLSRLASGEGGPASPDLAHMAGRLADSLSSLQAVSLRLTALIELGIELGTEREPGELLDTGCRVAQDICVARYACLGVLDDAGGELAWFASCGDNGRAAVVRSAPKAGVLATLLDKGTVVRMDGLGGDPTEAGLPAGHPPVHTFLGVPLAARGRVHGWLYLVDKLGEHSFSEVDERIAATVAAQIAASFESLSLYAEVRRQHAQLAAEMAERIRKEEDLRRFRAAMDASGDAIFLVSATDGAFIDVNATACRLLGYGRGEFLDAGGGATGSLGALRAMLAGSAAAAPIEELALPCRDGATLEAEVQRRTLQSPHGPILVAVARDLRERKEAERALHQLARFDTLTGVPNRTQFVNTMQRTLEQASQHGWVLAVLCIGLDRFKGVNDTLGHAAGDELLRQFSGRLVETLRARDSIGRLGGDEFGVVVRLADGAQGAVAVVDTIRDALRRPFALAGHEVTMTASVGIAVFPDDAHDAEALLKYAGTAMERAKEAGRDAFRFFTAEMNRQSVARLKLENALRRALDQGEFELHYQPKVAIGSGRIRGAEALLRWRRPGHGLVSPGVFIPLLEETGMIGRVGAWVIDEACRQVRAWLDDGTGPVALSVNVSGMQFFTAALEQDVRRALDHHRIDASLLELELTESTLMSHAEETVGVLRNLKALGVKISVDDFGTGYSSLAYLRRFPIDKLKIDIAFVRDIIGSPDGAAIVLAIIGMAHSLKLEVVAEGVEREEQLDYLRRHHCDEMQGFLFSPAVAPDAFAALLREGRSLAV